MRSRLPRRSFLRGLAGATLALPALEYFMPTSPARAGGGAPQRFAFLYGGVSTGRSVTNGPQTSGDWITPVNEGPGYDLRESLEGLSAHDVQDDTSIVTGLLLPWQDGGGIPAGGRRREFHAYSTCPLTCGVRSNQQSDTEAATGPTVDQVVADELAGDTPHRSLALRVQAANYRGGNGGGGNRGRITYRRTMGGDIEAIDPIVSPRLAFESLFGNFVPTDPAEAEAAAFAFQVRRSVLDAVREDSQALLGRLGTEDRRRIERHFDEIRALENRLDEAPPDIGGACQLPDEPGDDPPIGGANVNENDENYSTTAGYSNEELRADIMLELTRMAFACDLSRVASVMLTMAQCFLNMHPLYGIPTDFHGSGHQSIATAIDHAYAVGWHVDHFAKLVRGLRDTPDIDGTTLLDNTALVLMFEGGHGFDPQAGNLGTSHSTENMSVLIAGRAGGLNASGGQHIRATGDHPIQVVNTAMKAVGLAPTLGEVDGEIDGLIG